MYLGITIPLDKMAADEAQGKKILSEREQKIYNMICENLHLSVEQVMAELDISRATVFRDYAKLKKLRVRCMIKRHQHGLCNPLSLTKSQDSLTKVS